MHLRHYVLPGKCLLIAVLLWVALAQASVEARQPFAVSFSSPVWESLMNRDASWYASKEAAAVADNVLLYQRASGGWPKNIDMTRPVPAELREKLARQPDQPYATIDNGATYSQLFFLTRMIKSADEPRWIAAFLRGLDYLLAAQYDNGGWPQFYPLLKGYYSHITYNDDAMVGVLSLLRQVARDYAFVDNDRRERAAKAVEKGIDCILKTQLEEDGHPSAWCAQYDEETLLPAKARAYELVSLSGKESVSIVQFLMGIESPSPEVVRAIHGAIEWFEKVKIHGIREDYVADASSPTGFNKVVVSDSAAPPLWARFYLIGKNRPFFSDRDGKIYYDLSEISSERRNDYAWLGDWPAELLAKSWPAWHDKWGDLISPYEPLYRSANGSVQVTGVPFEFPALAVPSFPDRDFNIIDYGAVPGGQIKNTEAIVQTISACAAAGGGRVRIPRGIWLSGPIHLASKVNLHLEQGALLLFSREYDDYPLIEGNYEGEAQFRCTSPINAVNVENIAITGEGIIDGAGDAWRPVKQFKLSNNQWQTLRASGGVVDKAGKIWWPTAAALRGEGLLDSLSKSGRPITRADVAPVKEFLRPVMIRLVNCRNVLLDGPTFQNSPAWNIHPLMCENVIIRNISVRNPWYSQNGDGLDLESCRNVLVTNCNFDVGDDAICIKSGKNEEGRMRGRPSEKIVIQNCTVYHGHGGFTIGSEMSGGVENIWVAQCTFIGTDVGLRFKSARGRGGVVRNIQVQDIQMMDIPGEAILFDLFYTGGSKGGTAVPEVSEETPRFEAIHFRNIVCLGAGKAVVMTGLPEMPLQDITMENVRISAGQGVQIKHAAQIVVRDAEITSAATPVFSVEKSRGVMINGKPY